MTNFIEIERAVWLAPDLVTSVIGKDDDHGGHFVEVHLMGGQVVRCRQHMGPFYYSQGDRPDCYLLIGPHDMNFKDWTIEKSLVVAEAHAREVQAQIALYQTPVNIVPMAYTDEQLRRQAGRRAP